jgi:NTE family protein
MEIRDLFEGQSASTRPDLRLITTPAPETAFVLGGGGNLGAIQVGQLKALLERQIVPDAVIGCSVGSLNGAAIAAKPELSEVDRLAKLWASLTRNDIFPSQGRTRGPWLFLRNALSAYSDQGLRNVIERWLPTASFTDCVVPFHAVATTLRTGLEHWFTDGSLARALMASTALPGFLPPVRIDGEDYIDGGVVNDVPVSRAYELGARKIFVLDCGILEKERKDPKRPYEVLMHAVSIARAHRFRTEMRDIPEGVEVVRMPTIDPGKLHYDDFSKSGDLIDRSYRASVDFLDEHVAVAAA